MTLRIRTRPRGPLVLELGGEPVEIHDLAGNVRCVTGIDRLLLCRCGASDSKPMCDGAHNRCGFEAPAERAE